MILTVIAVAVITGGFAWVNRVARGRATRQRNAAYQTLVERYSAALKPGTSRS